MICPNFLLYKEMAQCAILSNLALNSVIIESNGVISSLLTITKAFLIPIAGLTCLGAILAFLILWLRIRHRHKALKRKKFLPSFEKQNSASSNGIWVFKF